MRIKSSLLAAALTLTAVMPATADATLFTVHWSGAQFGNSARATAMLDIDTATAADLGGLQFGHQLPSPALRLLGLTVTGSSGSDGRFAEAGFASYYFATFSPLDYSRELVGQAMANGCAFGSFTACYPGGSGDFNLFSLGGAPNGTLFFRLTTRSGENLGLTSFAPGVPDASTWALMIAGFAMIGAAARRRVAAAIA